MKSISSRIAALRRHPRLVIGLVLGLVALAGLGLGLTVGVWSAVCRSCPSAAQIYVFEPKRSTKLLAADGRIIVELGGGERRTPVALSSLPGHVPLAFVAIEDRHFFQHEGFSVRGIVRAAVMRVPGAGALLNRRAGGGSTITQQLARHMFEQQIGFEVRPTRKLKELKVARELEEVYSKEQILEAYINQINYGRGHHGIASAAQWMFGKPASALDVPQAALMAAVINRPEYYSPFSQPQRALARRNLVLGLMAREGFIGRDSLEAYRAAPLPEAPSGAEEGQIAPYFVEWVRGILDERYGSDLYERGYRVYTSLDLDMQARADEAMRGGWERIEAHPGFRHPKYEEVVAEGGETRGSESPYLQGAFIAIESATGEVRALIGGRDFADSKFNRAVQARRQPGSTFKPFVYTAAVASGVPASNVIFDAPIILEQAGAEPWSPRNYDGEFHGPMTIRDGLRQSINLVAVKLGLEVGLETVAQTARRMGISTPIPRVPSITIGSADVIPIQVLEAYSALASEGIRATPRPILRVEDADGRLLWETEPERTQVIDTLSAAIVRDMLREVVDRGTGNPARSPSGGNLPYDVPAAGKTGTTNDATDVWFVGFTPDLMAAVWFGFDRPRRIVPAATGGTYAAPVWGAFMRGVYMGEGASRPIPEAWSLPADLTTRRVDRETGKVATEWCPLDLIYTEIYIPGTEPNEACDLHGPGLIGAPLRLPSDSLDAGHPDSARISRSETDGTGN